MKCDCIKKVNEKLKQQLSDDAKLATPFVLDQCSGLMKSVVAVKAHYHKTKKDGTKEKKESFAWIKAEYCPFCGMKL